MCQENKITFVKTKKNFYVWHSSKKVMPKP